MATTTHNNLFSSLISDIKSYSGNDPLLPWLSGIRKMKDTLPQNLLKEKLPRFLQKCAESFESNRRYRNDLRYIRVWLQLMDYVDDPKALLRTMEMKKIGIKRALFYQAYALYYEKIKKFDEADTLYRLGVQNLAEPLDELQKSYQQFNQRLEQHRNKRVQCQEKKTKRPLSNRDAAHGENKENSGQLESKRSLLNNPTMKKGLADSTNILKERSQNVMPVNEPKKGSESKLPLLKKSSIKKGLTDSTNILKENSQNPMPVNEAKKGGESKLCRDDSGVAKFVDSAFVGRSETEDACHHGLVEPTINMKEAMNAINDMFREPIEPANAVRRPSKKQPSVDQSTSNVLEVFVDEKTNNKEQASQEPFKIFVDDEDSNELEQSETSTSADGSLASSPNVNAFVFLRPNDHHSDSSDEVKLKKSSKKQRTLFREDTVVGRFVGSAILDQPEVENICHHGLVDPTINLKEAMEDINGMFGKPIDFVRTTRRKRQENAATSGKNDVGGFAILPDDEFNTSEGQQPLQKPSSKDKYDDMHEPTVFTKQAMDDINNLFKMPLDF